MEHSSWALTVARPCPISCPASAMVHARSPFQVDWSGRWSWNGRGGMVEMLCRSSFRVGCRWSGFGALEPCVRRKGRVLESAGRWHGWSERRLSLQMQYRVLSHRLQVWTHRGWLWGECRSHRRSAPATDRRQLSIRITARLFVCRSCRGASRRVTSRISRPTDAWTTKRGHLDAAVLSHVRRTSHLRACVDAPFHLLAHQISWPLDSTSKLGMMDMASSWGWRR